MPIIRATTGEEIVVDAIDYKFISRWSWHIAAGGYAIRNRSKRTENKDTLDTRMHRMIARRAGKDMSRLIDHEDRNKLNNRRRNLRPATRAENQCNRGPNKGNRFKGVTFHTPSSKWRARIRSDNKEHYIGLYPTQEAAALAYNREAVKRHGEFAFQNEVG